jgi:hypothetical protein
MRRILQSKIGVSCLVAVALLCVAVNFFNLFTRRAPTAAARELDHAIEEAKDETYQVPPLCRVAGELRNWRETFPLDAPPRDPFAAVFAPSPATVTNTPIMPEFQLHAVSLAGGRALAVINRRVLAEGEFIENCRVERILPREVHLVSPTFGPITATFDRTPLSLRASAVNKPPSANPPPADLRAGPADASSPDGTNGAARQ